MKTFAAIVLTLVLLGLTSAFPSLNNSLADDLPGWSEICLRNPDIRFTIDKEAPFHVVLANVQRGFFCSGVILSSRWVLTAASCLQNQSFAIIAGLRESYEMTTIYAVEQRGNFYIQIRTVESDEHYIVHELYEGEFGIGNLALIYLEEAWDLDTYPEVKALNAIIADDEPLEGEGVFYGWGHIPGTKVPEELFAMNTTIHDYDACNSVDSSILPTRICTRNVADLCTKGSGAPLVGTNSDGQRYLVGLSSWEGSVCHNSKPLYYTNLLIFKDWIAETASQYEQELVRKRLVGPLPAE